MNIQKLPPEINNYILDYLCYNDIYNLLRVNRFFYFVQTYLWRYHATTALRWAARHSKLEMFEKALDHQYTFYAPEDFDIDTEFGSNRQTLLHLTTDCYDETVDDMVKYLINKKASLEAEDIYGDTPLELACERQNFYCAIALVENGARVSEKLLYVCVSRLETKSRNGLVPDRLLETFSHLQRRLISDNPRALKYRDPRDGYTPLMLAAYKGETFTVQLLLESTAKVDDRGRDNVTALMCAAGGKNAECVKLLVDSGADVNLTDINGQSAACRLPVDALDPQWSSIWAFFLEKGCDLVSTYWTPDVGTVSFLQHAVYQALKRDDLLLDLIVRHGTTIRLREIEEVFEALKAVNYDPECFLEHGFREGNIHEELLYRGHGDHGTQDPIKSTLLQLQQNIEEHCVTVAHKQENST